MAEPKPTIVDGVLVYPVKSAGCRRCADGLPKASEYYVKCSDLPPCGGLAWIPGLEGAVKWAAQQSDENVRK